jgi:hypothetical protein
MEEAVRHAALGLSLAALLDTGFRVASPAAARGLERLVAAAVVAAVLAVLAALGLGLVSLGTDALALTPAALAVWLAARAALPAPATGPLEELRSWWGAAPPASRLALGAVLGVVAAWAAWLLRHPALGSDSAIYHLPEVVAWIHSGRPGAVVQLYSVFPVGSYPLTNEVLLAWGSGIAGSFVWVALWAPLTMLLLVAGGWLGLRELGVGRLPRALAVASLCMTPLLTHFQMNGAHTDLPAVAWLVAAGALAAASRGRPLLLAPAILAAGLAAGTKTTVLPAALAALAIAGWAGRRELRHVWRPLALAAAAAVAVGGYWYLRNLVDHGSPFWPFTGSPWSDPLPLSDVNTRFIERPRATFEALRKDDVHPFEGGYLLLAAALASPFVARRRAVVAAGAATLLSLLIWMCAPFSGIPEETPLAGAVTVSSLRYLIPSLTLATLTVALAATAGRGARAYAVAALAAVLAIDTWQTFDLGFPRAPSAGVAIGGAAGGVLLALAAGYAAGRLPPLPRRAAVPAVALAAVAAGALAGAAAPGFVERWESAFAQAGKAGPSAPGAVTWLVTQPAFRDGAAPIAFSAVTNGVLAGDRLQHRIELVGAREACARIRARLRAGWVVEQPALPGSRIARCLAAARPVYEGPAVRIYFTGTGVSPARAGR